jgi:putative chitinase
MLQHIKDFQLRIGATPDGEFGKNTLIKAMEFYKISKEQCANFFGQCAHESGEFKATTENLNYSAERLMVVFKKYFPTLALANQYARQPQKIANRVYASRMGNGDEASGQGYKFRGNGSLQLTGKSNYKAFSDWVKDPAVMDNPGLVAGKYYFDSALFYFAKNNLWGVASKVDTESITALTRKVNGGVIGLAHRIEMTHKYFKLLS